MSEHGKKWPQVVLASTLLLMAGVFVRWNLSHSNGTAFDEANHLNKINAATGRFDEGILDGIKAILFLDPVRPPLYRLIGVPASLALGGTPQRVRLVYALLWLGTLVLIGQAASRLSGRAGGMTAIVLAATAPGLAGWSTRVMQEAPLYLAMAAAIVLSIRAVGEKRPSRQTTGGLGAVIGLGLMTKLSFPLFLASLGLATLLLGIRFREPAGRLLRQLIPAGAIGLVIAAPMFWRHGEFFYGYYRSSGQVTDFRVRAALGGRLQVALEYLVTNLGPLVAVAVLGGLLWVAVEALRGRQPLGEARLFLALQLLVTGGLFLAACLVLRIANARLHAPALIPLLIGLCGLTELGSDRAGRAMTRTLSFLALAQAISFLIWPLLGTARAQAARVPLPLNEPKGLALAAAGGYDLVAGPRDPWDWERVYEATRELLPPSPRISVLGPIGEGFNRAVCAHPWIRRGEAVEVEQVSLHLTLEETERQAWALAARSDLLLVSRGYTGWMAGGFEYGHRMARELRRSPGFRLWQSLEVDPASGTALDLFTPVEDPEAPRGQPAAAGTASP